MTMANDDGQTLVGLADNLIPPREARFLANSGYASEEILRLLGDEAIAQRFLSTLYWHAFVRTQSFRVALRNAGATTIWMRQGRRRRPRVERVVVCHGGGDQYDLVLLVSGYDRPPTRVMDQPRPSELESVIGLGPATALARYRAGETRGVAATERMIPLLSQAVSEVARVEDFAVVVAAAPTLERLVGGAAQPAVAVSDSNGELAASVGVYERTDGRLLATTALHAIGERSTVRVGSGVGRVRSRDLVTDSCVLELDHDPFGAGGFGMRGVCHTRPPRQYISVVFEGAGSGGPVRTVLHGFDESILDVQPFLATKLYTSPDTVPGDSGAALVDPGSDEILGFAAYRSSMAAPIRFAAWVWAEQVYDAHGL